MIMNLENLRSCMGDLKDNDVLKMIHDFMAEPRTREEIGAVIDALSSGMDIVGERFDEYSYFVGDLVFAGNLLIDATDILTAGFPERDESKVAPVVLCTVEGDLHDIGKNIVKAYLRAQGIPVLDLGVNVSPERICQSIEDTGASVLALSGVLSIAVDSMRNTIAYLRNNNLREQVKVVIGGSCCTLDTASDVGADAYSPHPEYTVELCQKWIQ